MVNSHRFFENTDCKYYPCHKGIDEINCLFCYCPMYMMENCPGNPEYKEKEGKKIKVCTNCTYPHRAENYDSVVETVARNIKK